MVTTLAALHRQRQQTPGSIQERIRKWAHSRHNIQAIDLHQTLLGHDGCINALCWSSDGRYLFSGSDDTTICVWRAVGDDALLCRFRTGFGERVFDLKVMPAPNDHLLVACSMDTTVKVFDIYRILAEANSNEIVFNTLRQTADRALNDGCYCVRTFSAHTGPVKRATIIPDSPYEFLSCSEDGTVRHFDIRVRPLMFPGGQQRHSKEGRIVADYRDVGAEIHALDVNIFHPAVFAAGGSLSSIMVHDRRMTSAGLLGNETRHASGTNWAGDRCLVRLRRDKAETKDNVFEVTSEEMVTGLRFSREEPDLVVGSWCYDHIYLFDLKRSTTYTNAVSPIIGIRGNGRVRESESDPDMSALKRLRMDVASSRQAVGCSSTAEAGLLARTFGRGLSRGIRILTEDEAPYMYASSSNSHTDSEELNAVISDNTDNSSNCNSISICRICGGDVQMRAAGFSSLFAKGWSCCDRSLALSSTEHILVSKSFETLVANMATGTLQQALASLNFALGSLGNLNAGGSERPHHCELRPWEGAPTSEDVKRVMVAMSRNSVFERLRIKSLLYNNRVCVYATIFRQRWVKRFNTYLSNADLLGYSFESMHAIRDDIRSLRSLLDSAMRDSVAALELNELNILAHYNRLLVAWDSARFDVMQLILELIPLIGARDAIQFKGPNAENDPIRIRLRAEFGDVVHRIQELNQKISAYRCTVHDETQAIYALQKILSTATQGEGVDFVTIFLIHINEVFFEMPSELAKILAHDASLVLGLFGSNSRSFIAEQFGGTSTLSYASILQELVMRWKVLSMESHDCDASVRVYEDMLLSPFCNTLFRNHCGAATEPHVYVWHRHLYCENGSNTNVHTSLSVTFDLELPVFPSDDLYYPDPEDRLNLPISIAGHSKEVSQELAQQTGISLEHPTLQCTNAVVGSQISMADNGAGEGTLPALQSSAEWPRKPCEFIPSTWNSGDWNFSSACRSGVYVESDVHCPVPIVMPSRKYRGHCSFQTIKDVNFVFGNYIASGSDDGCLFIWDWKTMDIVQIIRGDSEIVNIVEGHPALPVIAVSGLDSEVQIFHLEQGGPTPTHRRNYPVVQQAQMAAANICHPAARDACFSMTYTSDPYLQDLEYAHCSPLPAYFDLSAFIETIARPFPAVSKTKLAQIEQIVCHNEDMRVNGLSHSTLTNQILNRLLFDSFGETDDYESSNYSNNNNSDSGDDASSIGDGSEDGSNVSSISTSM
ncbi:WD40 repeat-like protein [Coemansia reversa NRRL 1564]|uniref:WD40 repeat-like protein n=1 Tax=Coemansia reversa (strain ATCC 12441 / NRRL 1564) TaxID=763665 RepID=A0A2G5B5Y7_COERN|nr:WD40 repeat-like protein [Coemansia reversa NRRL 1564]|eukprot:PIA14410.1 WD40 repeat-like protein [Coemansia reversa NRRL 1564]